MIKRLVVFGWMMMFLMTTGGLASDESVEVPGTYDLLVCKGPCSFDSPASVVARGVLVLSTSPFTTQSLNERSAVRFEHAYSIGGDPNGCFVLDTVTDNQTFAGLIQFGLTLWRVHSGQVTFELYQSPDAGYFATVAMMGYGFRGAGGSSGGAGTDADLTSDILFAKRKGPGDTNDCLHAASKRQSQ